MLIKIDNTIINVANIVSAHFTPATDKLKGALTIVCVNNGKPLADWFDILFCEQGAKKEYVSETDISHTAPLCFSFVKIAILTELDLQSATPSPAVTEMRPFERIAKIVSERPVGNVQNVKSRRADDSFTLENRDAR